MRFAYVKVLREVTERQQVFEFNELSPEVQEKKIEEYRKAEADWFWDFFDFEIKDSWEAIADLLGAELRYEYQFWGHSYTELRATHIDDEVLELEDSRAMAYIWNNWIEPNIKGKYIVGCKTNKGFTYNCVGKDSKSYYSKVTKEFSCPTGFCYDMVLWDAWEQWKSDFKLHQNRKRGDRWIRMDVADFLTILEDKMTKMVMDEAEYRDSDEFIKEELQERGEYFADGSDANIVTVTEVA